MTIEQVRKGMLEELDWEANEYGKYEEDDVKKMIAKDYKAKANAYNMLVQNLFGDDVLRGNRFPRRIERYIDYRQSGKWETW